MSDDFAGRHRYWQQPGNYASRGSGAFRNGIVQSQRFNPPAVRVTFPDKSNINSYWLNIISRGSQDDKDFWIPDVGEQVCVIMDNNDENGAVIGTLWSTADTISGMNADLRYFQFKDGTIVKYDRSSHQMNVILGNGGTLTAQTPSGNIINLDTSGNVNLTTGASSTLNVSQGGVTVADALVLVSKFIAQFNSHIHGGVKSGLEFTAPPEKQLAPTDVESAVSKVSN